MSTDRTLRGLVSRMEMGTNENEGGAVSRMRALTEAGHETGVVPAC